MKDQGNPAISVLSFKKQNKTKQVIKQPCGLKYFLCVCALVNVSNFLDPALCALELISDFWGSEVLVRVKLLGQSQNQVRSPQDSPIRPSAGCYHQGVLREGKGRPWTKHPRKVTSKCVINQGKYKQSLLKCLVRVHFKTTQRHLMGWPPKLMPIELHSSNPEQPQVCQKGK